MGKYRFKLLSELIPNGWFHKLRDMSGKSSKHLQPKTTASRTPCRLPSPPSKPPRNRLPHRPTVDSKSSTTSADSATSGTASFSPDFRSDQLLLPHDLLTTTSCDSNLSKSSTFMPPPELDLRPIITRPATTARKTAVSSPAGVKLRLRSPRISTRKSVSSGGRRSGLSTRRSRAVMKASVDPRRDFKESMEEMIAENNIRASKDLEELLACYLCLNSEEYHSIIINVFKQIWLELKLPLPHSK